MSYTQKTQVEKLVKDARDAARASEASWDSEYREKQLRRAVYLLCDALERVAQDY
jgi:hypothetical protein